MKICMISAESLNKSGSFYTEIKRQQIKLSLMLGLERAYEMFTSSITTIHRVIDTTHLQEPGRKNVDVSSCCLARNTRTVQGSFHPPPPPQGRVLEIPYPSEFYFNQITCDFRVLKLSEYHIQCHSVAELPWICSL